MSSTMTAVPEQIEKLIYLIRGQKVMLDDDLATLYEVSMKRLNEQVHRNIERFPADFMFQISEAELDSLHSLRSQFATSKQEGRGGRRYLIGDPFRGNTPAASSRMLYGDSEAYLQSADLR